MDEKKKFYSFPADKNETAWIPIPKEMLEEGKPFQIFLTWDGMDHFGDYEGTVFNFRWHYLPPLEYREYNKGVQVHFMIRDQFVLQSQLELLIEETKRKILANFERAVGRMK